MTKNIVSLVLLITAVALSFKHGWDTFNYRNNPESLKVMNELGIGESIVPYFGLLAIVTGILLLIPKTFVLGNILSALSIVLIMALALRSGNFKFALVEIPFLALPLIMIWLRYPFLKK